MYSSNTSSISGSMNITVRIPHTTPFAITKPISKPRRKRIKQRARKPNIVVSELPSRAVIDFVTAFAIASSLVA